MSFIGTVENGVIALPEGVQLADGTKVSVEAITAEPGSLLERYGKFVGMADDLPADLSTRVDGIARRQQHPTPPGGAKAPPPKPGSFAERYAEFIGMADDMPSDLASQIDHYIHGQPKRK